MNKIKILFIDGSWVDFEKPQGFNLGQFVHGVRSVGFILSDQFYVPVGMVKGILDMSTAIEYGTASAPQANAPTTETKQ